MSKTIICSEFGPEILALRLFFILFYLLLDSIIRYRPLLGGLVHEYPLFTVYYKYCSMVKQFL